MKKDKNIKTKAILYSCIMSIGGLIFYYFYYSGLPFSILVRFSSELFFPSFAIGLVLEGIRWIIRQRKETKKTLVLENPFWFDWIEASFSIWLLWLLALVIRRLLFY